MSCPYRARSKRRGLPRVPPHVVPLRPGPRWATPYRGRPFPMVRYCPQGQMTNDMRFPLAGGLQFQGCRFLCFSHIRMVTNVRRNSRTNRKYWQFGKKSSFLAKKQLSFCDNPHNLSIFANTEKKLCKIRWPIMMVSPRILNLNQPVL